jgi:hypothetical protein
MIREESDVGTMNLTRMMYANVRKTILSHDGCSHGCERENVPRGSS